MSDFSNASTEHADNHAMSRRVYRALLHLYPTSFRRDYGGELLGTFMDERRRTVGFVAVFALWLSAFGDLLQNAIAVHWDILQQDLRFTLRSLSRAKGFAFTAIVVTALGIGANTAAFSVADFVLIRPLPFTDPDRLVRVWEAPPGYGQMELSPPNYLDFKNQSRSFSAMGAYHGTSVNIVGNGEPERLVGAVVTADLLPIFGVQPLFGRMFDSADEDNSAGGTVILSYALWQRAFAGDPDIAGKRVLLDDKPHVVIGVMPNTFHYPSREVTLWLPMPLEQKLNEERDNNWFNVVARLKPNVTIQQAHADLSIVAKRLASQYPALENVGASVTPLRASFSSQSRLLLIALSGAAACVLLIACANLANLFIARAITRRRELDVRTALGAGRDRLVRQLLTESLLIALMGGALGVGVGVVSLPLLARLVPASMPIASQPAIDLKVLAFAAVVTLLTGIGFGVLPAIRASSKADLSALREGSRSGGGRRARVRSVLVIAEVMASVVLLITSGLLMRALGRIHEVNPGFRSSSVITMRTTLPTPKYDSTSRRIAYYSHVLDNVRTLPGVQSAAFISFLPMTMGGGIWPVALSGRPSMRSAGNTASLRFASPEFFKTLSIPLRAGRDIAESDDLSQPNVAVVSESFAKRYWPNEDAIGKRFQMAESERTVVGVVGEISVRGVERESEPQVYMPYKQQLDGNFSFYVPKDLAIRTTSSMAAILPAVQRIIHDFDSQQPISSVQTLDNIVADQTASRTVQVRVLGAFAAVAFLLAAIGIHGLLAFSVSERKHEIGVRVALGAQRSRIVGMVMRQGVWLALAGVIPGLAIAYAAGRSMEALLFGVKPFDTLTFVGAAVLCVVMTLAGSLLPVRRAISVPPAMVFRGE